MLRVCALRVSALPCARQFSVAASAAAAAAPSAASAASALRLSRIRNLGFIAHIDAGKTTTSERLLYACRRIRHAGDVDSGDTTMDFMRDERERGITIQSAAITAQWTKVGPAAKEDAAVASVAASSAPAAYRLNLIDTPGHVDFTQQVEQSLRVLDGAVLLIDAVRGVQAQAACVWGQAARYQVPRIVFVNKMDREGASLDLCVRSVQERLHTTPLVITHPLHASDGRFVGIIDLIRMEAWEWSESPEAPGSAYTIRALPASHPSYAAALAGRVALLEALSEADEAFMEAYLGVVGESAGHLLLPSHTVTQALRRVVCASAPQSSPSPSLSLSSSPAQSQSQSHTILLCGSSKASVGVQYLLNCVVDFLPSPLDRNWIDMDPLEDAPAAGGSKKASGGGKHASAASSAPAAPASSSFRHSLSSSAPGSEPLVALAFKVAHDHSRGGVSVVYVRVYSGSLRKGEAVVSLPPKGSSAAARMSVGESAVAPGGPTPSSSTASSPFASLPRERALKLVEVSADSLLELGSIDAGNIGALLGLKHARAGDTIVSGASGKTRLPPGRLKGIQVAEPVFFCAVEGASLSASDRLASALAFLQREDPSLSVSYPSASSGGAVLAGMGELHLDIVRSRLAHEFGLSSTGEDAEIHFGDMRIAYKEGLGAEVAVSGVGYTPGLIHGAPPLGEHEATLSMELTPTDVGAGVSVDVEADLSANVLAAAEQGVRDGLARGALLGYPVTDVHARVYDCRAGAAAATVLAQSFRACAARATAQLLRQSRSDGVAHLLEPVMLCELSLPSSSVGPVLTDLTSKRRAAIGDVVQLSSTDASDKHARSSIHAEVPLAALMGYASALRSTTAGDGSFSMQFLQFRPVPSHVQTALLESPP